MNTVYEKAKADYERARNYVLIGNATQAMIEFKRFTHRWFSGDKSRKFYRKFDLSEFTDISNFDLWSDAYMSDIELGEMVFEEAQEEVTFARYKWYHQQIAEHDRQVRALQNVQTPPKQSMLAAPVGAQTPRSYVPPTDETTPSPENYEAQQQFLESRGLNLHETPRKRTRSYAAEFVDRTSQL